MKSNVITMSLHPELEILREQADLLANNMALEGHKSWQMGFLCTRDHAYKLAILRRTLRDFLALLPEPRCKELGHPFKMRHDSLTECPVEKRLKTLSQELHHHLKPEP